MNYLAQLKKWLRDYFDFLERKGRFFNFAVGTCCALLIGFLDVFDRDIYAFYFFYFFPIGFVTWYAGTAAGILVALLCTSVWTLDNTYYGPLPLLWNSSSTLFVFCVITIMVSKIRKMWNAERIASRTDSLTGAMNLRAFTELMNYELMRVSRDGNPFTVSYLDIDNFKEVNDRFGHDAGDDLLKYIAATMMQSLRRTDVVARIGGDEFTIFMPATDCASARFVMTKMNEQLLHDMLVMEFPVTFSIGVLTCTFPPPGFNEIVKIADNLMYEVKNSGKNDIRYGVYDRSNATGSVEEPASCLQSCRS